MAINLDNITTIRVDQLATATLNIGNEFAHSQGSELKKATIQDLVDIVSTAVGAGSGVGFLPISVTDGQQLPSVPADPSFFLCGPGTYLNVNGFPDVVCTDELNAIMSLSDHWQLSVGIPITPDLPSIGISQSVNSGTIDKAPSENAVYNFVYNYVASQILKSSLGYFDYNDLATQTTPISVPSNTQTLLTNDTLGANTDITQPPFGVTRVYEGSTANEFDFSQLSIGDTVDIRIHLKTTTSANNQLYHIDMKAGIGSASEFENRIFSAYVKTSAVDEQTFVTTFYVGNADIRDYPAQLFITSIGNTATVKVVGWFVRVFRKSVNIVDIVVAEEAPIDGLIYGRQDAEWVEVTGGGGSQTLAETLVLGNETDGEDILVSDGDAIILDNGSKLIKGTTDSGLGGNKGIALRCSIDYELKWEAGRLYVMEQDGFTIREVSHTFDSTPDEFEDITKGFVVGSRWILDNGDVYLCEQNDEDNADWTLVNTGITPTLQQVTDKGNTIASGDYLTMVTSNLVEVVNVITNTASSLTPDDGVAIKTGIYKSNIKTDDLTVNRVHQLPDSDGTLANDLEVVHNTGDETIAGAKTFSSLLTMPSTGVARVLQVESSGQISGLDLATFPSPNELIYVKGVTNAIQTQLDGKLTSAGWVDYSGTSTIVGWASFTTKIIRYQIVGKTVNVWVYIAGVSNSTITSITLNNNASANYTLLTYGGGLLALNNATSGHCYTNIPISSSNIFTFGYWTTATSSTATWTALGTKSIRGFFSYEID